MSETTKCNACVLIGRRENQHDNGGHALGNQTTGRWVRAVQFVDTRRSFSRGRGGLRILENAGTISDDDRADQIATEMATRLQLPIERE